MNFPEPILIITLIFLLIISLLDLKFKAIPSVFLTGFLFVVGIVNMQNFFYAAMLTVFALLLYEFNFMSGIADIKVAAIVGFLISSHSELFLFILLFTFFGLIYKILVKYIMKERDEVAFLPVFFFSFLCVKIIMSIIYGGVF